MMRWSLVVGLEPVWDETIFVLFFFLIILASPNDRFFFVFLLVTPIRVLYGWNWYTILRAKIIHFGGITEVNSLNLDCFDVRLLH